MKKIVCLLLISVIFLSLYGCSFLSPTESWSGFNEYDNIGFDLEAFIKRVEQSGAVVELEENFSLFNMMVKKQYSIQYPDETKLRIFAYENTEDAKEAFAYGKNEFAMRLMMDNPYVNFIRIDNLLVFSINESGNASLVRFAIEIGIPDDDIELKKNNSFWRISRRNTGKSLDGIIQCIQDRGYSIIDKNVSESNHDGIYLKSTTYIFVSEDFSTVYQLYVTEGENAKAYLYTSLAYLHEFYQIKENNCHVYYSVNDECCMYLMGATAETKDFWDDIR